MDLNEDFNVLPMVLELLKLIEAGDKKSATIQVLFQLYIKVGERQPRLLRRRE